MSEKVIERNKEALLAGIPLGRFGGREDLKGAAIFLSSSASDFVTGHILVVDGGQSA
jgi:gluconate 5-dehydrogenase